MRASGQAWAGSGGGESGCGGGKEGGEFARRGGCVWGRGAPRGPQGLLGASGQQGGQHLAQSSSVLLGLSLRELRPKSQLVPAPVATVGSEREGTGGSEWGGGRGGRRSNPKRVLLHSVRGGRDLRRGMDLGSNPTVCPWASQFTSLTLSFLVFKMGAQNSIYLSQACWEKSMQ